jgi:hypothetical protein
MELSALHYEDPDHMRTYRLSVSRLCVVEKAPDAVAASPQWAFAQAARPGRAGSLPPPAGRVIDGRHTVQGSKAGSRSTSHSGLNLAPLGLPLSGKHVGHVRQQGKQRQQLDSDANEDRSARTGDTVFELALLLFAAFQPPPGRPFRPVHCPFALRNLRVFYECWRFRSPRPALMFNSPCFPDGTY